MGHKNGSRTEAGKAHNTHASKSHKLVRRFGIEGEPDMHKYDKMEEFMNLVKQKTDDGTINDDPIIQTMINQDKVLEDLAYSMGDIHRDPRFVVLEKVLFAINHGRNEDALSLIEKQKSETGFEDKFLKFEAFLNMNRFEDAIALCDDELNSQPDPIAVNHKAYTLIEMNRVNEAVELYEEWSDKFIGDPSILAGRAIALAITGNTRKSEKLATRALKLEKICIPAYIALSIIVRKDGDPAGAIKILNKALDLDMNENDLYIYKADILAEMGEYEKAMACCRQRLTKVPGCRKIKDKLDLLTSESMQSSRRQLTQI